MDRGAYWATVHGVANSQTLLSKYTFRDYILNEVNQMEKDRYHVISLPVKSKNNGTNELIYKTETESQM